MRGSAPFPLAAPLHLGGELPHGLHPYESLWLQAQRSRRETSRETPPPHPIGKESSEIIAQEGAKDEERDQMLADPDHPCITSPLQIINILEQTAMEK